jgi:hypothetical protein
MNQVATTTSTGSGIGIGAGFGAFIGILTALLVGIDITYGLVIGAGTGVLVGLQTNTFVERRVARGDSPSGGAIGAGLGIVFGAGGGLVAAAMLSEPIAYGIVVGAGAGLLIGLFLGVIVLRFSDQLREEVAP